MLYLQGYRDATTEDKIMFLIILILKVLLFVDVNIFRLDLIEKGLYKILTEYPVGSQHLAAFLKMKMMRRGFVSPFLSSKFRQHNRTFYL